MSKKGPNSKTSSSRKKDYARKKKILKRRRLKRERILLHQIRRNTNRAKFADTAIEDLLVEVQNQGAKRDHLIAKIAGGAEMFQTVGMTSSMRIGYRNVVAVKEKLEDLDIAIIAEDTGENYGRTIEMDLDNGELRIKTIMDKMKII